VNPDIKERIKHSFVCLISGATLPIAFAPFNFYLVAVVAPAILFFYWLRSKPQSAFLYGYCFGFGLFGIGVNWLHISINLFGGVNLIGALISTYILVAFLALYPALVGYISSKFFSAEKNINLLLVMPCLWVISEWCRSWIFTGFPWLNLGYSQIESPLSGLAPITGVYGISFIICLISASLVYIYNIPLRKKYIALALILFVFMITESLRNIYWTNNKGNSLNFALIQGAIPQQEKWKKENREYTRDLYLSLTEPYWGIDLIIWPETAIPALYHQADFFLEPLMTLTKRHTTDLLTGIPVKELATGRYFNSIINIGSNNESYHKQHLVPFGEYLPFDKWLRPVFNLFGIPMSNFSSGTHNTPVINAAGEQIGLSICYEDVFGEEVIGAMPEASLLVNISNDAWFGDSFAPHQHLQMARMRSLETGRYMLRATNTGISAIIDEKGKIISQSPQFVPHALKGRVHTFSGMTPYAIYGNLAVILTLFLILVIIKGYLYKKGNIK